MATTQSIRNVYNRKFDYLWNKFQNGYTPSIYNPEQAAGCNGRRNSLMLSIPIEQTDVLRKIQQITDQIAEIPGVYVMPSAYYHITVKWLGFLTDRKQHNYDIEPQMLEQILEQADQILSNVPAFSIRLGSVNGLASFVIIEVEDNGAIAQIQGRFHEEATLVPNYSIEGERWLPHLSIAAIKSLDGLSQLKAKVKELRHIEIGEIPVTHINLSQAILQKPCPECRKLRHFPLAQTDMIKKSEGGLDLALM